MGCSWGRSPGMKTSIRIAQIRVVPKRGDLSANCEKLMDVLGGLTGQGVDVVVTPECFLDGYIAVEDSVTGESLADYAIDPANSPYVEDVSTWAREDAAWVVLGCSRLASEGVANSALLIDRKGDLTVCCESDNAADALKAIEKIVHRPS